MKKGISIILSFILLVGILPFSGVGALQEDEAVLKSAPFVNSYVCDKERVKEKDPATITVDFIDTNIKTSESILNVSVSVGKECSFSGENAENTILQTELCYDPLLDGAKIVLQLKNITYLGNGHKLSISYRIKTEQYTYDNSLSFCVLETMYATGPDRQNHFDKIDDIKVIDDLESVNEVQNVTTATVCGILLGSDQRVLETQKWLNATYDGRSGYTRIPENGVPGGSCI